MKHLLFTIAIFGLMGCGGPNSGTAGKEQVTEDSTAAVLDTPAPEAAAGEAPSLQRQMAAPASAEPFEETLVSGSVSFRLQSPNTANGNTLTISPSGLQVRNDVQEIDVEGLVESARLADLNQDGFPEVYIFARESASQRGHVYAFTSYRNRSYGQIYVVPLQEGSERLQGYEGQDAFELTDTRLLRSFPVYKEGQATGQERVLTYQLLKGEASFRLELASSQDK
jgi:hypothetical protein